MLLTPVRKSARVAARKASHDETKSSAESVENLQSTPVSQRRRKNGGPVPFNNSISNEGKLQGQQDSPLGTPRGVTAAGKRFTRNVIETPPIDVSMVNDSFLDDLDKMEADARASQCATSPEKAELPPSDIAENENGVINTSENTGRTSPPVGINKICLPLEQKSPDMFGNDSFDVDCLPASQFQMDPTTPARHAVILNKSRSKKRKTSFPPPPPPRMPQQAPDQVEAAPKRQNKPKKKGAANTKDKEKKKKSKFKLAYTNRKKVQQISNSGNNELSRDDLTGMSEEEKLQLASWGLPQSVLNKYYSKGVRSLFEWQLECLTREGVLEGKNLLYSAPTSAGKTLVAELLMVKRVLELGKKAIMILPYVSVCREKMFSMQEILGDAGIRVEGFMGSYAPPGGFKSVDIAICTIEKANSLLNRLLEEDALGQVGTVVVDELHLIGDSSRGTLLELILTKIKYMVGKSDSSSSILSQAQSNSPKVQIQVIGMSATLPNLDLLASWIDAELVVSEYRPVPLVEHILLGGKLLNRELEVVRDVHRPSLPVCVPHDDSYLVYLSLETVLAGHSVLIFCPTKAKCEAVAQQIAQDFWNLGSPTNNQFPEVSQQLREQLSGQKLSEVLTQLKQCPGGLDDVLKKSVAFGVAFHHAGLTYDERDIVESAFKRGVLRVIVATSTLSAGVNLPARRVIISTPMFNGGVLDALTYRQMCGRAGRKGVDTEGESILVCSAVTKPHGIALVQSSLPNVRSALLGSAGALTSSMKRALLEVIASGIATLPEDVHKYARATLLSKSIDMGLFEDEELPESQSRKEETIHTCLDFLVDGEFIRLQKWEADDKDDEYVATQLGAACLASSLAPDDGVTVYKELQKARCRFVLETDLHIVYQVTPIYLADNIREISWLEFLNIWNDLNPGEREVGKLVGVDENFIFRAMTGVYSKRNSALTERYSVHQRFFVALALNDLVNEMPISKVADKYCLNKGLIQSLQQSASTFAGMVTSFCGKLGWSNLELLLSQFQERLQFGVQRELCDLVRLSTMNGQRARVLYDAGIKTVAALAASEPAHVEHILHKAAPFQSTVHGQTEESVAKAIWVIGKNGGLSESEAARSIVNEARQFIQLELGLPGRVQYGDELNENEENEVEGKEEDRNRDILQKSTVVMSTSSDNEISHTDNLENHIDDQPAEIKVENVSHDSLKDLFSNELETSVSKEDIRTILRDIVDNSMDISEHNQLFDLSSSISKIDARPLDSSSEGIRHSTPSNAATKIEFPNKRISAIHPYISDLETPNNLETRQAHDEEMHINDAEFEAAFGKDFDSVASLMEVSLNISTADDNKERAALDVLEAPSETVKKNHVLSESDAAALQVMVNDSSAFHSEDMFADLETSTDKASASRDNSSVQISASDEGTSSCVFDSDVTNSGLQSARGRLSQEETMLEVNLGQSFHLKVMKACSPNFIPSAIFNSSKPLSMAYELCVPKRTASATRCGIGSRILGRKKVVQEELGNHYISLYDGGNKIWVLECIAEPEVATKSFSSLVRRIRSPLIIFDAKERLKRLIHACGLKTIPQEVWDPKVAQWMWRYDTEDFSTLSTSRLIDAHVNEDHKKVQQLKWPKHVTESYLAWHVMKRLKENLIEKQLWKHFTTTEMPSMVPLLLMELNGFGVEGPAMSKMKKALEVRAALLEMRAFSLAGRQFNLSSPKEVKQILFREMGLKQPPRTTGTGKDVLIKLNHELAGIILEWRKVSSALQKVMIPFMAERNLETNRIHGKYSHLTVTGRTVMCEPSLQCVPRDFTLEIHFSPQEISDLKSIPTSSTNVIRFGSKLNSIIKTLQNTELSPSQEGLFVVSLRSLFTSSKPDFVLVSADYSQLELRILAHLSQDETLAKALNDPQIDVFIAIASQWKKLPSSQINDGMRQEAKGIVYGVIYGMGVRALAEAMEVEEADAARFVAEFMRSYPGVRTFLSQSIKTCRDRGYVETISGRRRYLPHIDNLNPALKSQAERQAVNTQIQGSASDLVKTAMTRIQARLADLYPNACSPVQMNAKGAPTSSETVCFPILNLHDELMFEVRNSHVPQITALIKEVMESSLTLSVRLPVVIKCGTSWGKLSPVHLN